MQINKPEMKNASIAPTINAFGKPLSAHLTVNTLPDDQSAVISMSSREIAELVESRHDSVKRAIERLADKRVIQLPPMVNAEIINGLGKKQKITEYLVSKRDSYVVVAQLCPEFTARLVDRWQELEAQVAAPSIDPMQVLSNPAAMRGLLLSYTEKVLTLESQVQEMKPDVQALNRIAKSDGGTCITDAAKDLQMRPKDLFAWLSANGWIYRRAGGKSWLAYQTRIQSGHLEHKVTVISRSDGTEKTVEQVLVTPKGLTRLSHLMAHHLV